MYAIIGGSGIYAFPDAMLTEEIVTTSYGSVQCFVGAMHGHNFVFLPRHGSQHKTPPHRVNYRANVLALKTLGVTNILATHAVGGIAEDSGPGAFVVPDQVIDYSWGREHTFFDDLNSVEADHIDFTHPFSPELRELLIATLKSKKLACVEKGTYACTQGPRLETAAEVKRLKSDGCTIVGMTAMPEAALARELNLNYASLSFVVNWAAGLQGSVSMDELKKAMDRCVDSVREVLTAVLCGK